MLPWVTLSGLTPMTLTTACQAFGREPQAKKKIHGWQHRPGQTQGRAFRVRRTANALEALSMGTAWATSSPSTGRTDPPPAGRRNQQHGVVLPSAIDRGTLCGALLGSQTDCTVSRLRM